VYLDTGISPARSGGIAVSRDGRQIAFVGVHSSGRRQIYVRSLDTQTVRAVSGTERGSYPVWSPDGTQLGFRQGPGFKRMAIDGGEPPVLSNHASILAAGGRRR